MKYNKFEENQKFYFHRDKVTNSRTAIAASHYHNLFEIYYITSGTCVYFIDNKSYDLIPGDIILIPEGTIHNTEYRTLEHSRLLINCSQRFIPTSVRPLLGQLMYLYRNPDISREVHDLFLKIEDEYTKNDSMHEDILRCYTHMLFFLLARNRLSCTQVSSGRDYIEKAIDYLQNNFTTDITLSEMADMFSVTPVHFSRMFKKETGFGFCEYINILRLQKAETLISQSSTPSVTQIAAECGFADSNYFSVKFKKMYGTSPKSMMKKNSK